jgi:hypothetical protein
LPQEARTLIKRMTAQKPYERPQKIEEVLEELAHIKESIMSHGGRDGDENGIE